MKRRWIASGASCVALAVAAAAFAPLVRGRVEAFAQRKHMTITVGRVLPRIGGVRLSQVVVTADDLPGIRAAFDEVEVDLSLGLKPKGVLVHGGLVSVSGSPDELKERVRSAREKWASETPDAARAPGAEARSLAVRDVSAEWNSGALKLEASGIRVDRTGTATSVQASSMTLTAPEGRVTGTELQAKFGTGSALEEISAATLSVAATPPAADAKPANPKAAATDPEPEPAAAPTPAAAAQNGAKNLKNPVQAGQLAGASKLPAEPEGPLLALPNLVALRTQLHKYAQQAAARLPEGAHVQITKFAADLPGADGLSIGPGPVYVAHLPGKLTFSFKSEAAPPSPPLALDLTLPLGATQDVQIALDGGPVGAALLGLKNGKAGILDAELATAAGKANLTLAGSGESLTFDVNVKVSKLGLKAPRISAQEIHGLTLGIAARGVLAVGEGALRLDNFDIGLGELHVTGSGGFEQHGANVRLRSNFAVPVTSCDAMLKSMPSALLPALQGSTMQGTFGMHGALAFDSQRFDDLQLSYAFDDRCKFTAVAETLARGRFAKSFEHTVYKPDGSRDVRMVGPGSENWRSLSGISPFMQVAVLTTEDGTFRRHHGFNHEAIRRALISNLKARRFAQGASTISMQLTKNLFLTREKTLARKLEEVVLTSYLEQVFDKDELLELYLNIVELGPNVYGVNQAAHYYFGREAEELNLAECMFFATLLPSPVRLSHVRERGEVSGGQAKMLQTLMKIAEKTGKINASELEEGMRQSVRFAVAGGPRPAPRGPARGSRFDGNDADPPVPDEPAWAPIEPRP